MVAEEITVAHPALARANLKTASPWNRMRGELQAVLEKLCWPTLAG